MKTPTTPISNVRMILALVADAPANFETIAEEAAPWGTRFVINFADLPAAKQTHPLFRQLAAIVSDQPNDSVDQIWLETK